MDCKEIQPVHPKGNQSWVFIGRTDIEAKTSVLWPPEELTHLKRPWCWERLQAGGEGGGRGWVCWMASPTQWPWVWVNSRSWWWTGRPGMLQSMGSQIVGHDWVTEVNWNDTETPNPGQWDRAMWLMRPQLLAGFPESSSPRTSLSRCQTALLLLQVSRGCSYAPNAPSPSCCSPATITPLCTCLGNRQMVTRVVYTFLHRFNWSLTPKYHDLNLTTNDELLLGNT